MVAKQDTRPRILPASKGELLDVGYASLSMRGIAEAAGRPRGLGARLARLEGVIALTTLHARFPAMQLAIPPSALRWDHGEGPVLRGLSELPVILRP